jgi:hypothetical protein
MTTLSIKYCVIYIPQQTFGYFEAFEVERGGTAVTAKHLAAVSTDLFNHCNLKYVLEELSLVHRRPLVFSNLAITVIARVGCAKFNKFVH